MRIALIGMGRMGRMIRDCAADRGIEVAAEFNTATIAQLAQCDRCLLYTSDAADE